MPDEREKFGEHNPIFHVPHCFIPNVYQIALEAIQRAEDGS